MSKFARCEPDDPNRCQGVGTNGQCPFKAVGTRVDGASPWVGSAYCPRHGANAQEQIKVKESHRIYLSALWKDRIGAQADNPKVKSLREEMGILRMMVNEKLDSMQDRTQLLLHCGQVTEMVREIGKLAKTAHHIEKDMGQLLDKTQAEAWVQELLGIIGQFVDDGDVLVALSEEMVSSLERRTSVQ